MSEKSLYKHDKQMSSRGAEFARENRASRKAYASDPEYRKKWDAEVAAEKMGYSNLHDKAARKK